MTLYCQRSGGEAAGVRDKFDTYDHGLHRPFASPQQAAFSSQYPIDWTHNLTRAYLHGMPDPGSYMRCAPESATSHKSAHVPAMRQDHGQAQHSMERPSLKQKLRRLRSLEIPDGRLLPSTDQPAFQSATSQAPSSITTSGLQCFESSSQTAECSRDFADGMSFHSNTSWTSPAMTIADSISPASSFQLKQAPCSIQDYQPAFPMHSPLTTQDIQQPVWIPYSPAFPCDGQDAYAADLSSSHVSRASYETFPITFQALNIGLPYEQTDMSSASSWFPRSDVANPWSYSTFQPAPTLCWNQDATSADSGFVCSAVNQPEFVTPTQLVSNSSPVVSTASEHSSPSVQAEGALHRLDYVVSSTQHEDDELFPHGSKSVQSISDERQRKGAILLKLRKQGLSYKEIKKRTGWSEADSTLRGMVRVLSRPAHERVRKPLWKRADILLLEDAIRAHHDPSSPAPRKRTRRGSPQAEVTFRPPWQKVAAYVSENGGSYPFSASACAKKWVEVADSLNRAGRR